MTDVLIRDIDPADHEQLKAAAAATGEPMAVFLRRTLHAEATRLRRQEALAGLASWRSSPEFHALNLSRAEIDTAIAGGRDELNHGVELGELLPAR